MNVKKEAMTRSPSGFFCATSAFPLSRFCLLKDFHMVVQSGLELLGTGNIPGSTYPLSTRTTATGLLTQYGGGRVLMWLMG